MRSRPPLRSRALGGALVVMFAVVQIAGIVHAGETAHARCAEHGELIDLPDGLPDGGDAAPAPAAVDHAALAASHVPGGHHHCAFGQILGGHALAAPHTPLTAVAPHAHAPPHPPALVAELRRASLYRLAPKTSPPAVAVA